MIRSFPLLVALSYVACATASRPHSSQMAAPSWLGCYQLTRGDWDLDPEVNLHFWPGTKLRLRDGSPRRREYYWGPESPGDRSRARGAELVDYGDHVGSWWEVSPDSIIVAVGQLAGVTLYLGRRSDSVLEGSAVTFTDIGRMSAPWVARASLEAKVVACT